VQHDQGIALASDHNLHLRFSYRDHFLSRRHRGRLLSGDGLRIETIAVAGLDRKGVPETDPAGRVKRARFGENYSERIETWEDR
jgi:hypothetical protein